MSSPKLLPVLTAFDKYINLRQGKNNYIGNILNMGVLKMKKFFWNIFVKSGSIDAFLGFKECEAAAVRAEAAAAGAERK